MNVAFTAPGLPELVEKLRRVEAQMGRPEPLLKRWGVQVLAEIDRNFEAGGRPAWKPLSPWTIAGRRDPGRKKGVGVGGAKPLQDTGALRRSYTYRVDVSGGESKVVVYSRDPKALWHEFGVKPREEIRPRFAQALALPALMFGGDGNVIAQKSLSGLGKSKPTGRGGFVFQPGGARVPGRFKGREGQNVVPYKNVMFRKVIKNWPGIAARPMLPTQDQILPILHAVADAYWHEITEEIRR